MGEKRKTHLWAKPILNTHKTIQTSGYSLQANLTPWIGKLRPVTPPYVPEVISGYERLPAVFSAITFDIEKLERWKHHRYVQADDTDRLICSMTFSDQVMALTLGQIFNMNLLGQIIVHSMRLNNRNTMLAKWMSYRFWVKSYCRKNVFFRKKGLFRVLAF